MYFSAPITTTKLTKKNRRLLRFIPPKNTLTKKLPFNLLRKIVDPPENFDLKCQKKNTYSKLPYFYDYAAATL